MKSKYDGLHILDNRQHLTARKSIQSIIFFARDQDNKITVSKIRMGRAYFLFSSLIFVPVSFYVLHSFTLGYWRTIYPGNIWQSLFEIPQGHIRQSMVPEMYLKDRQQRKIQILLKQSEQIKQVWQNRNEII